MKCKGNVTEHQFFNLCAASGLKDLKWNDEYSKILEDLMSDNRRSRRNQETQTVVTVNNAMETDVEFMANMYSDNEMKNIETIAYFRRLHNITK